MNHWLRCTYVVGMALLSLPACGRPPKQERRPVYPVEGQVFYEGKPTPKAVVWLHPVSGADPDEPMPRGIVAADGSFKIATYTPGDGAPTGQYRLVIAWTEPARGDNEGKSLLPARYANPRESTLPIIDVRPGTNVIPKLNLTP